MFLSDYKSSLPAIFYSEWNPTPVKDPKFLIKNKKLAEELGMDPAIFEKHPGYFSGNEIPKEAHPIAMAYSGHQFGHYVRLGDGRAILLGEWKDASGKLWDIQLKGSGPSPYSRGGDGRGALGPMLREFLISEAMHALGIPSTRSLAVVATGEGVYRHRLLPGAVLTRVAASHLRVGTFQYALEVGGEDAVKDLLLYAIERHDRELLEEDKKYQKWFLKVLHRQANLVAAWMAVGFIHGVMNTDNMSISGETIDYGPCAFMDYYDPATVFSSIDLRGRYALGRQPLMAQWNLARLAETLLPLLEKEEALDLKAVETLVGEFAEIYRREILQVMARKLGIMEAEEKDEGLLRELLQWMKEKKADYTNTFCDLTRRDFSHEIYRDDDFCKWREKWQKRLQHSTLGADESLALMKRSNPVIIPRNHLVEESLKAYEEGDAEVFLTYWRMLLHPYNYEERLPEKYRMPLGFSESRAFRSFCGT